MRTHHVFYWLPMDGAWHAIGGEAGSREAGEWGQALCDVEVRARGASEHKWVVRRTCGPCWDAAKAVLDELNDGCV